MAHYVGTISVTHVTKDGDVVEDQYNRSTRMVNPPTKKKAERKIDQLMNLTVRADTLEKLNEKLIAHIELLGE